MLSYILVRILSYSKFLDIPRHTITYSNIFQHIIAYPDVLLHITIYSYLFPPDILTYSTHCNILLHIHTYSYILPTILTYSYPSSHIVQDTHAVLDVARDDRCPFACIALAPATREEKLQHFVAQRTTARAARDPERAKLDLAMAKSAAEPYVQWLAAKGDQREADRIAGGGVMRPQADLYIYIYI